MHDSIKKRLKSSLFSKTMEIYQPLTFSSTFSVGSIFQAFLGPFSAARSSFSGLGSDASVWPLSGLRPAGEQRAWDDLAVVMEKRKRERTLTQGKMISDNTG